MEKPDYLPKKMNIEYLTAICPICKREYKHVPFSKPNTCGELNCVYALAVKRMREFAEAWNKLKERRE